MNKSHTLRYSLAFIIITFIITLISSPVGATVGGPTYMGSFTYNRANESVYYIETSSAGRGCPPELKKMSLVSGIVDTAFSCDQGENLRSEEKNFEAGTNLVLNEISKITTGFKDLTPISLSKNNIQIDVEFVKTENLPEDPSWIIKSHFLATVYQNGKKVDQFEIAGCNQEQPFTFAGYAVPGLEKKIVLLSSTKGDCFEGGYTIERLSMVKGVDSLNKEHTGYYKSPLVPLVPSESTMTIYKRDTIQASSTPNPTSTNTLVFSTVIALVAGIIFGKLLFGKEKK